MQDCIFCKIIKGEIPAKKVYEDDLMIVIFDIEPKAKIHLLAIPKSHYKLISDQTQEDNENFSKIISKIPNILKDMGIEDGYRLVINQGETAGQTVFHLHIHILAGENLSEF